MLCDGLKGKEILKEGIYVHVWLILCYTVETNSYRKAVHSNTIFYNG